MWALCTRFLARETMSSWLLPLLSPSSVTAQAPMFPVLFFFSSPTLVLMRSPCLLATWSGTNTNGRRSEKVRAPRFDLFLCMWSKIARLFSFLFLISFLSSLLIVTVSGVEDFVDDGEKSFILITEPVVSTSEFYSRYDAPNINITTKSRPTAQCSSTTDPNYKVV